MKFDAHSVLGAVVLTALGCGQVPDLVDQEIQDAETPSLNPPGGTSDEGSANEPELTAQSFFETSVGAEIQVACGACHSATSAFEYPKFLPAELADYYASLKADSTMVTPVPSDSWLLVYGAADVPSTFHAGIQFNENQEALVVSWLEYEAGIRSPVDDAGNESGGGTGQIDEPEDPVDPVNPNVDPEQLFIDTVRPGLQSQCAGCHEGANPVGPVLMGLAGADDDYGAVTANTGLVGNFVPDSAMLLVKGPHSGAVWWDSAQVQAISTWLNAEYAERNGGSSPAGPGLGSSGPVDLMAQFVGCMDLEDWDAELNGLSMGDWALRDAEGDVECQSCHSDGEYFFAANGNNERMYEQQRTSYFATSFFTLGIDDSTGLAAVKPNYKKLTDKCNGTSLHPGCEGNNGPYFDVIEQFYTATMANLAAGECGPAAYLDDANVIEAQDLILDGYVVDQNNGNGEWIRLPNGTDSGTATGVFNAPSGTYQCYMVLIVESDGQPTGSMTIGAETVWSGTYPLGDAAFQQHDTIPVTLDLVSGDAITWTGTYDQQAYARWDELRCLPVD